MRYGNFFSGRVYGVKFSSKKFVDIDTKKNLDYANYLLKKMKIYNLQNINIDLEELKQQCNSLYSKENKNQVSS